MPVAVPQDRPASPHDRVWSVKEPVLHATKRRKKKEKNHVQAIVSRPGARPVQAHAHLLGRGAPGPARVLGHQQGSATDAQRDGKRGRIGMKIFNAPAIFVLQTPRPNGASRLRISRFPRFSAPPVQTHAHPPCGFLWPIRWAVCRPDPCQSTIGLVGLF